MSEEQSKFDRQRSRVHHLPKSRAAKSLREQISEDIALSIAGHFREQNETAREACRDLSAQVQRLMVGIDHLIGEMNGVRTGSKDEAFARVGPIGAPADLPTVSAEAALFYTLTAEEIGIELGGFRASQIGILLGARGLRWAGDGDYQELSRHKKPGQTKFWHREVPEKIRKILDQGSPEAHGISDKQVLAVFRKWKKMKSQALLFDQLDANIQAH